MNIVTNFNQKILRTLVVISILFNPLTAEFFGAFGKVGTW